MRRRLPAWKTFGIVALLVCVLSGPRLLRAQQTPPPTKPSGSIAGVVVDAANGRPLAGAKVRINAATETVVGADGRFALNGLSGGHYYVSATREDWIGTGEPLFGAGVALSVRSLDLAEGESITALTLRLSRCATVSGYVRDDLGRPLVGVEMALTPVQPLAESNCGRWDASTDDRGFYRLVGSAGRWLVSAHRWQSIDSRLVTRSPASATLLDPLFYPGVRERARAAELALTSGEARTDVSFQIEPARTFTLAGRVLDSHGSPVADLRMDLDDGMNDYRVETDIAGRFQFTDVLRGHHVIRVEPGSAQAENDEWARDAVDVEDRDVRDLLVTLRPSAHLTGRIDLRDGLEAQIERGVLEVCSPFEEGLLCGGRIEIAPDRTFRSEGLVPGRYELRVYPRAGFVEGVQWGGLAVRDHSFMLESGDQGPFVVTLSPRKSATGVIAGRVTSLDSTRDAWVVVIPAARADWIDAASRAAAFRRVLAGATGAFVIRDVPPGHYLVSANDGDDSSDSWRSPRALDWLAVQGTAVIVADGSRSTVDLELRHMPTALLDDAGTPDVDVAVRPATHTGEVVRLTVADAKGTGRLSGRVLATDSGAPVVGAKITASSDADSAEGVSDALGRFELTGLTAGTYSLLMQEPSFGPSAYGAAAPGEPGQRIVLKTNATVENLVIKACRGAVITGRVTDAQSRPVRWATVHLTRQTTREGLWAGNSPWEENEYGFLTTDDRGEYRAFGLAPGSYVVGAYVGGGHGGFSSQLMDYWPGGVAYDAAVNVVVSCGEERTGIDIRLRKDRS